jgi:hypothetical protein
VTRSARLAALAPIVCGVHLAVAGDYQFAFGPGDARFDPALAHNRASMAATLRLLRDFAGAGGIRFVLVGEEETGTLVRRRVEAVAAELTAASADSDLVTRIQWQATPLVQGPAHVEGLSLMLRVDATGPWSTLCPYQVQIADPRLPPVLAGAHAVVEWVPATGLTTIPVSAQGSVRVLSRDAAAGSAFFTAVEMLPQGPVRLQSGVSQAQWQVARMTWDAGVADVRIDPGSSRGGLVAANPDGGIHKRDIGNVVQDWKPPKDPSRGDAGSAPAPACDLHFVLSR